MHGAADRRISDYLADGKLIDAVREAHTVKGLAGQIGARELYQAACRLETALKSSSPDVDAALQTFADSLSLLVRGMSTMTELQAQGQGNHKAAHARS
jgi:HPt (histidine-containing phosphotransfer) domain-containing protein